MLPVIGDELEENHLSVGIVGHSADNGPGIGVTLRDCRVEDARQELPEPVCVARARHRFEYAGSPVDGARVHAQPPRVPPAVVGRVAQSRAPDRLALDRQQPNAEILLET